MPQTNPFNKLPRELRDKIWEEACVDPAPLIGYVERQPRYKALQSTPNSKQIVWECKIHPQIPEIAQTSRSLRSEALQVFLSKNIFIVDYPKGPPANLPSFFWLQWLWTWLLTLESKVRGSLRGLELYFIMFRSLPLDNPMVALDYRALRCSLRLDRVKAEGRPSSDGLQVHLTLSGAITEECTCSVSGLLVEKDDSVATMSWFLAWFDQQALKQLQDPSREFTGEVCSVCSKGIVKSRHVVDGTLVHVR